MDDPVPVRLPVAAPAVPAPPLFVERRAQSRRAADRVAHEERALLAKALDVLAGADAPEQRLAGLLDLLAHTVGAERAAVVADGVARRVAVAASGSGDRDAAIGLATWLDSAAPRSRARRAAAARAPISVALRANMKSPGTLAPPAALATPVAGSPRPDPSTDLVFACLTIPSAGEVTLGFSFCDPADAAVLEERLPPALARHAAVALTLVTDALAKERELARLRAVESQRGLFVSTVAHELRTPLTGLSGYLDLILGGRVGDAAIEREFMERGRTIVGSMAALVDDLLELSRLESGTLALEQEPFSVADALNAVSAGLLPIALDQGVRLQVSAPPRLRAATGDRRRVEQIVTNLAANAIKFAGDRPVELAGWFEGPVAVIAVRDEGPGIAPADRERIFERFYRMADHDSITGTGLGLPIARDLARAMGGELDAASLPGVGSSFVLVMPGPAGAIPAVAMSDASGAALDQETDRLKTLALLRAGAAATDPDRGRQDERGADEAGDEAADGSPATGDGDRYTRPGRRDQLPAGARR
jgi:nitrogen-specific signal transduction histidine kinase